MNGKAWEIVRNELQSRQDQKEQEEALEILALIDAYGINDDREDGTVLRFVKDFKNDRKYHYAGVKSGGRWFLTGYQHAGTAYTWPDLVLFLVGGSIPVTVADVEFWTPRADK